MFLLHCSVAQQGLVAANKSAPSRVFQQTQMFLDQAHFTLSPRRAPSGRIPAMTFELHLGTSAFTAAGWEGSFYPAGMKPADYLTYYATKFETVEVDSTFYRTPAASTVSGWARKTPEHFIFAAKVPQLIPDKERIGWKKVSLFVTSNCQKRKHRVEVVK